VWWYIPVIPAIRRQRQEDLQFEASLGNTETKRKRKISYSPQETKSPFPSVPTPKPKHSV
jgi:hypothetical protein